MFDLNEMGSVRRHSTQMSSGICADAKVRHVAGPVTRRSLKPSAVAAWAPFVGIIPSWPESGKIEDRSSGVARRVCVTGGPGAVARSAPAGFCRAPGAIIRPGPRPGSPGAAGAQHLDRDPDSFFSGVSSLAR